MQHPSEVKCVKIHDSSIMDTDIYNTFHGYNAPSPHAHAHTHTHTHTHRNGQFEFEISQL